MTTDREALQIADRALPGATRGQKHFVLAVTRFETHYGDGWKIPEAVGSNNWGAVQDPKCTEGRSFKHTDHHADGTPYTACFATYPTPDAGLRHAASIILKQNVVDALKRGDGAAAVAAMKVNRYFEANEALYRSKVADNYAAFIEQTGEPVALSFSGVLPVSGSRGGMTGLLGALAFAGAGVALIKKWVGHG